MLRKPFIAIIILFSALFLLAACNKKKPQTTIVEITAEKPVTDQKPQLSEKAENTLDPKELPPLNGVRSIKVGNIGALATVFNDTNDLHLKAAAELGIDPIRDLSSAYFMKRPIVKVADNDFYHIDSLRHSLPFLVPEAAQLLSDIGKNFIDSLKNRGGDSYTIKVTSLLRTPSSVERLKRVNVNAADSSAHQFATTFDISWSNFYCLNENRQINQGDLKNLLAEVLKDLRDQGRCYVKFEKKTACFHVTVRK